MRGEGKVYQWNPRSRQRRIVYRLKIEPLLIFMTTLSIPQSPLLVYRGPMS
jgi:hypothetical protein